MTTPEFQYRIDKSLPLKMKVRIAPRAPAPLAQSGPGAPGATSNDNPLINKLLLSPAEVCAILSIKKTTLYKWLKEGLLRSTKIGGKRLIQADSVRELSAACLARGDKAKG